MKTQERRRLERVYGALYHRHFVDGEDSAFCYYCGEYADTLDHSPSLANADSMRLEDWHKNKIPFVLVPACHDCNSRLGVKPLYTIEERCGHILKRLDKAYKQHIGSRWTNDEIADMGPNMKSIVGQHEVKGAKLQSRANHAEWRFYADETHPEYNEEETH